MELSWAKHVCFFFFFLQHVDGSFSVKPLKQKQIVGSYISTVLFDHSANSVEFKTNWVCATVCGAPVRVDLPGCEQPVLIPVSVSLQVDRVSYLLQEIYGIENKNNQETKVLVQKTLYLHLIMSHHDAKVYHSPSGSRFVCICFSLPSPRMTRTVTTATSVLSVCPTCETRSSCPADICVSATRAPTPCVTRPTTVPSAGCVRATFFPFFFKIKSHPLRRFADAVWRRVRDEKNELTWACVTLASLQSPAADPSCEEKARRSLARVVQPRPGSDDGPRRALSKTHAFLMCLIRSDVLTLAKMCSSNIKRTTSERAISAVWL